MMKVFTFNIVGCLPGLAVRGSGIIVVVCVGSMYYGLGCGLPDMLMTLIYYDYVCLTEGEYEYGYGFLADLGYMCECNYLY